LEYHKSDKPYDRPELASFNEDWGRTIIKVVKPIDDRLMAVVKALSKTHVNGGAVVAQFRIEAVGGAATALATNRLKHVNFFSAYFGNAVVQETLPQVANARPSVCEFEKLSVEQSIDHLATAIRNGGAYRHFRGPDGEEKRLARRLADAAFDPRMQGTCCWYNDAPWTDWFFDVAWDRTFFWYDTQTRVATNLLITDTD
jgi:hypothetical protein